MFSLRMLMAVVAISAVYIAGMVYHTKWWEAGILTLTYVIYSAAISAAILSQQRRAFFVAFAVFGVTYGLCQHFEGEMLPHKVIEEMGLKLPLEIREPANDPFGDPFPEAHQGYRQFISIGDSFVALLISLVAGAVAEAVVSRKQAGV